MYLTALRSALMAWYEQHPTTTAAKSSNYKVDSTTYKITPVNCCVCLIQIQMASLGSGINPLALPLLSALVPSVETTS